MTIMRRAAVRLLLPLVLAVGCSPPPRLWRLRAASFRAGRQAPSHAGPAGFVERSLHDRGLRFATDGSVGSLYGYLRGRYDRVPPGQARPGDVVFFDLDGNGCASHAGLVDAVDPPGRIAFRERRDGEIRRSYAAPAEPRTRRDSQGRILNTFLRARRLEDAPGLRYFSGEMLCAVIRVKN
jgi:hypothetical protein